MDNKVFQIYERRIENCWQTANVCAEGTWGKEFWTQNAMYLLRRMNSLINGGTEK